MSLFNKQRGVSWTLRDKLIIAWNIVGMITVLFLLSLLWTNFGKPILKVPTEGVVAVESGVTVLYGEKNFCITRTHLWSFGELELEVSEGAC